MPIFSKHKLTFGGQGSRDKRKVNHINTQCPGILIKFTTCSRINYTLYCLNTFLNGRNYQTLPLIGK